MKIPIDASGFPCNIQCDSDQSFIDGKAIPLFHLIDIMFALLHHINRATTS